VPHLARTHDRRQATSTARRAATRPSRRRPSADQLPSFVTVRLPGKRSADGDQYSNEEADKGAEYFAAKRWSSAHESCLRSKFRSLRDDVDGALHVGTLLLGVTLQRLRLDLVAERFVSRSIVRRRTQPAEVLRRDRGILHSRASGRCLDHPLPCATRPCPGAVQGHFSHTLFALALTPLVLGLR
jgi:hypothetical protein